MCLHQLLINNYMRNMKAFWKVVNEPIKSSIKNRIETLTECYDH